jgi:hypothetical protein
VRTLAKAGFLVVRGGTLEPGSALAKALRATRRLDDKI